MFKYRDLLNALGLGNKKVVQILEKEGVEDDEKLRQVLAEEETISECKQQNQKVIDFLTKREILSQLIHYATRMPRDI
jgi:hypothetical protein